MPNLSRLPVVMAEPWDWQLLAKCRGEDPNIFFHPPGERDAAREERIKIAKSICEECPVIKECADHALYAQEPYGIWGGMSELEIQENLASSSVRPRGVKNRKSGAVRRHAGV